MSTKFDKKKAELAAPYYPAPQTVLFWAFAAAIRVAILATAVVYVAHPLVIEFSRVTGLDEMSTFFVLGLGLHSGSVAAYIAFFAALDHFGWLQKYKLKRPAADQAKNATGLFWKALKLHLLWHGVVRVLEVAALWVIAPYGPIDTPLPAPQELISHFIGAFILGELFLYFYHRVQHENKFLARFHRVHHEYEECESINAEYSDWFELTFLTALSYLSTSTMPMTVHFVTILWKVAENQEVHSGYCFRGSLLSRLGLLYADRAEFHDFHHSNPYKGNFGKPVYFDYLFHTCDDFILQLKEKGKKPLAW